MIDEDTTVTANFEPEVDMSPVEIVCSREFKKKTNGLHRQTLCRSPRKLLVPVKMPSKYYMPGVVHRPQSYEIERCDGVCHHANHKCLPVEKEIIEVPVTRDYIYGRLLNNNQRPTRMTPQEKCMNVKIEKHILCGCKCVMTELNCNDKQTFSEDRCLCECKDVSKGKTCSSLNKMWDPNVCDCQCPPTASRSCSSGAVFDEETCRCMQTNEFKKPN